MSLTSFFFVALIKRGKVVKYQSRVFKYQSRVFIDVNEGSLQIFMNSKQACNSVTFYFIKTDFLMLAGSGSYQMWLGWESPSSYLARSTSCQHQKISYMWNKTWWNYTFSWNSCYENLQIIQKCTNYGSSPSKIYIYVSKQSI